MQDFLSMGGYAAFVWPSYGLTAVVLLALLVASLRGLKSTEAQFERLKAQTAPRTAARGGGQDQKETETPNGDEA